MLIFPKLSVKMWNLTSANKDSIYSEYRNIFAESHIHYVQLAFSS